jgi:hypothetical protein
MAERRGRDLYVMGAANVGKTAFVAALLQAAGAAGQLAASASAPLQSGMPGTTLGMLPVAAFTAGGLLYGAPAAAPTRPCQAHALPCATRCSCLLLLLPRRCADQAAAFPWRPIGAHCPAHCPPCAPPPPLLQTRRGCTSPTAPSTCCRPRAWQRSTWRSSCGRM